MKKFVFLALSFLCAIGSTSSVLAEPSKDALQRAAESPLLRRMNVDPKGVKSLYALYEASSRVGGKRFGNVPPNYLPQGDVHVEDGKLVFDLLTERQSLPVTLTVKQGSTIVYQQRHAESSIRISAGAFQRGVQYNWSFTSGSQVQQASFKIIDSQSNTTVEQEVGAVLGSDESEQSKLWLVALVYHDWGLYSARDRVFAKLASF